MNVLGFLANIYHPPNDLA